MPGVPYAPRDYYHDPFVGSIADLIGRGGQQRADALRRDGDRSAQMWSGLAQTAAGTIGDIARQHEAAPLRAEQLKAAQQANDERGLRITAAQQGQDDRKALDAAGTVAPGDRDAFLSRVPGHLRTSVEKQFADLDRSAADARTARANADEKQADYFGMLANAVEPYLKSPDGGVGAFTIAVQHAKEAGYQVPDEWVAGATADPSQLPTLITSIKQRSPSLRAAAQRQDAQRRYVPRSVTIDGEQHEVGFDETTGTYMFNGQDVSSKVSTVPPKRTSDYSRFLDRWASERGVSVDDLSSADEQEAGRAFYGSHSVSGATAGRGRGAAAPRRPADNPNLPQSVKQYVDDLRTRGVSRADALRDVLSASWPRLKQGNPSLTMGSVRGYLNQVYPSADARDPDVLSADAPPAAAPPPLPPGRGGAPPRGGRTATADDVRQVAKRLGISDDEARRQLTASGVTVR